MSKKKKRKILNKYYDTQGNIIINTDEGDVVIVVDLDFMEVLNVGDKICICSYDEVLDKYELFIAKWFSHFENHREERLDEKIFEIFAEEVITIREKWYGEKNCTCFAEINNQEKIRIANYLISIKQ